MRNRTGRIIELKRDSKVIQFDRVQEAADFLSVSGPSISYAAKRSSICKGWTVRYLPLKDLEGEVWCEHPIHQIKVSNRGRILHKTGCITTGYITSDGRYLCVTLEKRPWKVHRLVGETFIDNPCNKPEIDHIDRNGLNNHVENLRWVTRAENCLNRVYER